MPELDPSVDVLLDGFVAATRFVVVRRRSWTDVNGIAQKSEQRIPALGSVTPTGDNSLDREDAFQLQSKTLLVITKFFLRAAASDEDGFQWQPDLVFWQDDYFLVSAIEDYTQFNSGFVAATCQSFDYLGDPPRGQPPIVGVGHVDFRQRNNSDLAGALL